jgi:hypothetical protein
MADLGASDVSLKCLDDIISVFGALDELLACDFLFLAEEVALSDSSSRVREDEENIEDSNKGREDEVEAGDLDFDVLSLPEEELSRRDPSGRDDDFGAMAAQVLQGVFSLTFVRSVRSKPEFFNEG